MDTNLQRLRYLFLRHQAGKATVAERRELMEIIRSGEHEPEIQVLIEEAIANAGQPGQTDATPLSEDRAERIFSRIVRPLPATRLPIRRIPAWIGWAAAAAVILVTLVSLPYLKSSKQSPSIAAGQSAKYDAAPGKKAAVLTLADGRQVTLDSADGGTIGRQGNSTVINLKGALAYNAAGDPAHSSGTDETAYNTLSTNASNHYQLILPDGSHIWLNAASSVKFPVSFSSRERSVEITGEAYFEIAKDARRPFLVHYKDMTVQVLGTSFNVNAYTDEQTVATTLLDGSVKVLRGNDHTLLAPGQQVQLSSAGMKVLSDINTDEIVAWKDNEFYFRKADIRGIMRQLARWYNIKVDYEGQNITERFYARIPRSVPLSEILKALSLTGKVHFRTGERTVTVSP